MLEIDTLLKKVLMIYVLISTFFYYYKPPFMFDNNGKFKQFGTGPNKTIYPFWLVTTAITLVIYVYFVVKNDEFV